jgi:hypothetical protein
MQSATEMVSSVMTEIVGDFLPRLEVEYERAARQQKSNTSGQYWYRRQRGYDESGQPIPKELPFELLLFNMVSDERYCISLNEGAIPSGRRIPAGTYSLNLRETGGIASSVWRDDWYVHVAGDSVDLANIEPLSDLQLKSLLAPAPVEPVAEPTPRQFKRTPRIRTDNASRLGMNVGQKDGDVICPNGWAYLLMHITSPVIIGSVSANIEVMDPRTPPMMMLKLFDAVGEQILAVRLTGRNGFYHCDEFEQTRLKVGDYLFAIFAPNVRACGSYRNEHVGVFPGGIPSRPLVDELMKQPAALDAPVSVGFPTLRFLPE